MPARCITFGAGGKNYREAVQRLVRQAYSTHLFDIVVGYTEHHLQSLSEFWEKHSAFIQNHPRGFGYWLWKPYLIHTTMEQMADGDVLLYLDCGCEIDVRKTDQLREYLTEYVNEAPVIGSITFPERAWTKQDLIDHIGVKDVADLESPQCQAGALLFRVCEDTRRLVKEWYTIGCNYECIDDSPSNAPNCPEFQEHRHDQSIFSLLVKKYGLYSQRDLGSVVEYRRNRTGYSRLLYY